MSVLIKKVKILNPASKHHNKQKDVLIKNGSIEAIGVKVDQAARIKIEGDGLVMAPGFVDINTQVCDPGMEHREDLNTISAAAAAGGFTHLAVSPETEPFVDSKQAISYLKGRSTDLFPDLHPLGALSKAGKGEALSEMLDLHTAGALGFTDGIYALEHNGLMQRSLEYAKTFGGLVISNGLRLSDCKNSHMHEGAVSVSLGLKGIPAMHEAQTVQRDLDLLRYTGGRLHINNISSKMSLDLINKAKDEGLNISCSVPALNLLYTDEQLHYFDTNMKVMPPLRSAEDRDALLAGLRSGLIDAVSSNHHPLEHDLKKREFYYAESGVNGLEVTLAVLLKALSRYKTKANVLVERLSIQPRNILSLNVPLFTKGESADLVVFDPNRVWEWAEEKVQSKSKNHPWVGKEVNGKVLVTIKGKNQYINKS